MGYRQWTYNNKFLIFIIFVLAVAIIVLSLLLSADKDIDPPVSPVSPLNANFPDLDGNKVINDNDLAIVKSEFGKSESIADVNQDSMVDIFDVVLVAYAWGDDYRLKYYLPVVMKGAK